MGGKGSGGHRVGAGRRRKGEVEGALTGSRRTRSRAKQSNQTAAPVNQSAEIKTEAPAQAAIMPPAANGGLPPEAAGPAMAALQQLPALIPQ